MNDRILWGDLHSHCDISYGSGSLERALRVAAQQLDFCSITGHASWPDMPDDHGRYGAVIEYHRDGFERLRRGWAGVQDTVARHHRPGQFVPLLSYEWHSIAHGDHNVYLEGDRGSLHEANDLAGLAAAVPEGSLLVPHHIGYGSGARGIDWATFDAVRSPVVEMYSSHGASERDEGPFPIFHTMGPRVAAGTVEYGLRLGHRFGLIASTDHHAGYPGHHGAGRTAVLSDELTRSALFAALRARRCYAVTGDKIELDFRVNGAVMGSELSFVGRRELTVRVRAEDALDRIEVLKNGRTVVREASPELDASSPQRGAWKVRLEWGWGEKDDLVTWNGAVTVDGGDILRFEPLFRGEEVLDPRDAHEKVADDEPPHAVWSDGARSVRWTSRTRGNPHPRVAGTSGVLLELHGGASTRLRFEVNGHAFTHSLAELAAGAVARRMRGWLSETLLVHRAIPEAAYVHELRLLDDGRGEQTDVYRVRVGQRNGEMAWSSPIWIDRA